MGPRCFFFFASIGFYAFFQKHTIHPGDLCQRHAGHMRQSGELFSTMGTIWSESHELRNAVDVPTGLVGAKLVLKIEVFRVQSSPDLRRYLSQTVPGVKHIHLGGNLLTEHGLKAGLLQHLREKVSRGVYLENQLANKEGVHQTVKQLKLHQSWWLWFEHVWTIPNTLNHFPPSEFPWVCSH